MIKIKTIKLEKNINGKCVRKKRRLTSNPAVEGIIMALMHTTIGGRCYNREHQGGF